MGGEFESSSVQGLLRSRNVYYKNANKNSAEKASFAEERYVEISLLLQQQNTVKIMFVPLLGFES